MTSRRRSPSTIHGIRYRLNFLAACCPPGWKIRLQMSIRDGIDFNLLAMDHLAAFSGAAHKGIRFRPYRNSSWFVPPVVWVLSLARSGMKKTAARDIALDELRRTDIAMWQEHLVKQKAYDTLPKKEKRRITSRRRPNI